MNVPSNRIVHGLATALFSLLLPLAVFAGQVDINKADASTIAKELKGIGPAKAKAIVEYREKNGAFKNVDDLLKVKGIGAKMLEQNRDSIIVASVAPKKTE